MTSFAWGSATHVGQVRQVNQDDLWTEDGLFAVADGMGGHRGGEVASAVALEGLRAAFTERTSEALVAAVQSANELVVEAGQDPELRGMGTTLAVLALVVDDGNEVLSIANVGDSRVYLLRAESEDLEQITEDHSLVATLQRQGQLSTDEASAHPQRNVITRALGIDASVLVDSWDLVPVRGDRYLLCSDGLVNEVDDARIAATLRRLADPGEAAAELVRQANEHGGRDNITVVVVDVTEADFELDVAPGREERARVVRSGKPDDPFAADLGSPTAQIPVVAPLPEAPGSGTEVDPQGTAADDRAADTTGEPPDAAADGPTSEDPPPAGEAGADDGPEGGAPVRTAGRAEARALRAEERARARAEAKAEREAGGRSRFTWRVGVFLLALAALVAATVGVVVYAAENTWFVRADDGEIAIWKGRPGGLLWIDPEVVEATDLRVEDAPAQDRRELESDAGKDFASLDDAQRYLERVRASTTTTTTSTTSTSTTLAEEPTEPTVPPPVPPDPAAPTPP